MIYRAVPSGAAKNELRGTRAEVKLKVRTPWLIKTVLSSLQLRGPRQSGFQGQSGHNQ